MITLKVPDMHCEKCAARITRALEPTGVDFTVSLEDKTVVINGCENCAAKAKAAIEAEDFHVE